MIDKPRFVRFGQAVSTAVKIDVPKKSAAHLECHFLRQEKRYAINPNLLSRYVVKASLYVVEGVLLNTH